MKAERFRKKPVVVEAVIWSGHRQKWPDGWPLDRLDIWHDDGRLFIQTPEGTMTAQPGDWVVRGTAGELYPVKPDIFPTIYEAEPTRGAPESRDSDPRDRDLQSRRTDEIG